MKKNLGSSRVRSCAAVICLTIPWSALAEDRPAKAFEIAPYSNRQDAVSAKDVVDKGRHLFSYYCSSCHGAGHDHPGTEALDKRYGGSKPGELALRSDIPPNLTKYYVRNGASIMPFFRKADISDDDLNAIASYLARNVAAHEK